jgi:hypothetical protein
MLTKNVKYVDAAGNPVEEELFFQLTKAEITEMEYSVKGGLSAMIQKISTTKDPGTVIAIAKELILKAYVEQYTDAKGIVRFLKNQDIRDAFAATEAYSTLFMSFVENVDEFNDFIIGIMPLDMQAEIRKAQADGVTPAIEAKGTK